MFQKNLPNLLAELEKLKENEDEEDFQHWLLLVFWFVTHLEQFEMAERLLDQYRMIKKLVACALQKKRDDFEDDNPEENEEGEEWHLKEKDEQNSNNFMSEELSEEEKEVPYDLNHDLHNEGGESDDDDSFFDDEKSHQDSDNGGGANRVDPNMSLQEQVQNSSKKLKDEEEGEGERSALL